MPNLKNTHPVHCLILSLFLPILGGGADAITVIAHRGDSGFFPENTLTAFNRAIEKRADLVELDSHVTKDGVLVVMHDSTLDRTTQADEVAGATGIALADKTWAEIQRFEAGSWKSPVFSGERIPTLEESIRTIQKGSVTLLERKAGPALAYAKLLEEMGLTEDLIVQAFDWEFLAALRTWSPKIKLGALGGEEMTEESLDDLQRADISLVVWREKDIDRKVADQVKRRGMELWSYTIDEAPEWRRLIDLGVTGLITNTPGALREWLEKEGLDK